MTDRTDFENALVATNINPAIGDDADETTDYAIEMRSHISDYLAKNGELIPDVNETTYNAVATIPANSDAAVEIFGTKFPNLLWGADHVNLRIRNALGYKPRSWDCEAMVCDSLGRVLASGAREGRPTPDRDR